MRTLIRVCQSLIRVCFGLQNLTELRAALLFAQLSGLAFFLVAALAAVAVVTLYLGALYGAAGGTVVLAVLFFGLALAVIFVPQA